MSAATTLALAQVRRKQPVEGLADDATAPPPPAAPTTAAAAPRPSAPIARLARRYWWTLPLAGMAIYASYRSRSTGKKPAPISAVAFDTIGVLGALASLVALIELEASKSP